MPIVQRPIIWFDGIESIEVDRFVHEMRANFFSDAFKRCLNQAVIYGDEQAPLGESSLLNERPSSTCSESHPESSSVQEAARATSGQTVTKCLTPKFDSGADFSIIPEKTLTRLRKSYTSKSNLHPEHMSRMTLVDVRGESFVAVGIVPLLWYLDSSPSVLLSTTFYVVRENIGHDLIIGSDVMHAVAAAVAQDKAVRSRGPRGVHNTGPSQLKKAVRLMGMLRHRSSGSLRGHAAPRPPHLPTVDETAAVPNGSAG